MKFSNSYSDLGDAFYQRVSPTPVSNPELLLWNHSLAKKLNIEASLQNDPSLAAQYFSGNQLLDGADSMALAYSGHQFGHWAGQLGDGRAINLGELVTSNMGHQTLQLKAPVKPPTLVEPMV